MKKWLSLVHYLFDLFVAEFIIFYWRGWQRNVRLDCLGDRHGRRRRYRHGVSHKLTGRWDTVHWFWGRRKRSTVFIDALFVSLSFVFVSGTKCRWCARSSASVRTVSKVRWWCMCRGRAVCVVFQLYGSTTHVFYAAQLWQFVLYTYVSPVTFGYSYNLKLAVGWCTGSWKIVAVTLYVSTSCVRIHGERGNINMSSFPFWDFRRQRFSERTGSQEEKHANSTRFWSLTKWLRRT